MITKRYVQLIEAKEKLIEKINEAKECGDQAEAERLEEDELFMTLSDLEEEERRMSPTHSTFKEDCESER